jgi:hypothetical protein
MTIDKALLREVLAHYRAWNKDVFMDRVLRAGEQTPAEKWRTYQELMSFGLKIRPTPSIWQQWRTIEDWETYYARIKKFEEKRRRKTWLSKRPWPGGPKSGKTPKVFSSNSRGSSTWTIWKTQ